MALITQKQNIPLLDKNEILNAILALKNGDFSYRMPTNYIGVDGKIADAFNEVMLIESEATEEIERISIEAGKEGKLNARANLISSNGSWKKKIISLNELIANLSDPLVEITRVINSVSRGDLSQRVPTENENGPLKNEFLQGAKIINSMVEQMSSFTDEVLRVTKEVGTDGKLGGQAQVEGVSGTWKELTDNVNLMAANLTAQMRNISEVTFAVANGDLSKKITVDVRGEILQLKETINTMVDQLRSFSAEVTRVAREVGTDGKLGSQAVVFGVAGTWKDLTDSVNLMAANLTDQMRNISEVTTAVANGDLNKKITVEARGEILELKNTINTMVDQLSAFSSEVTRVAREVGTDGTLGGQAVVEDIGGTWRDLTNNVNIMTINLTDQMRNISEVTTAVANGDLNKKITVEARGEILELKNTINTMVDQLSAFASEVTRVAREVGTDGKLGGQATVEDVGGIWRDLTNNVNSMAANLTIQVRAIAEVANSVTRGDLNQTIEVEASGELADLRNNINRMIENLRDTTKKNADQDWLKSNLAHFTRMLQGERNLNTVTSKILSEIAPLVNAQHGVFYIMDSDESDPDRQVLKLLSSYAYKERKNLSNTFFMGEGVVGQCALEKQRVLIAQAPPDYIKITSGLGESIPVNIVVLPVLFEGQVVAVIELASLQPFSQIHISLLDQLMESIGIVINNINTNSRTVELLKQSQSLTEELQAQQEELQQTNEELEEKANALNEQNTEVERKNKEIEQARNAIEEKAEQLAVTSKYKSEFLANMSHELRTPLNSLLILAQQLMENQDKNLNEKQVKFAQTIHAAGSDLLTLINDILDLSKVESGTVIFDIEPIHLTDIKAEVENSFQYIVEQKNLKLDIELGEDLPDYIHTDSKRMQQIIRNLISNAMKFTEKGKITFKIDKVAQGWNKENQSLNQAKSVIAFSVIDTGIGISADKQKIIFEAFHQADSGTSRKYGGTGLGLSISREISRQLGGELKLIGSKPNKGSHFTLFLPEDFQSPKTSSGVEGIVEDQKSDKTGVNRIEFKRDLYENFLNKEEINRRKTTRIEDISQLPNSLEDDRLNIGPDDKTLLIIEDDIHFAPIILDVAHEQGFKGIIALNGRTALVFAHEIKPSAITLDINLPDMNGLEVLDYLKKDPETMHIPVDVISVDDKSEEGIRHGAFSFMKKPAKRDDLEKALSEIYSFTEKHLRKLLVVEDDPSQQKNIVDLLKDDDIDVITVKNGKDALKSLAAEDFDCMVLDLKLPDMSGFELLEEIHKEPRFQSLPIIVYTAQEISRQEENRLMKIAKSVILKDVRSPDRLLSETSLFLHRVATNLPEAKRKMLETLYDKDTSLQGRKVLIVDDDMRNIFALTALLENNGLKVSSAESGREAIKLLDKSPDIEIVLMDIMMPELDGYETIQLIRKDERFKKLPLIALTAKAMKGDREKCISVGASDYIPKPIVPEQLVSLLRIWLYK